MVNLRPIQQQQQLSVSAVSLVCLPRSDFFPLVLTNHKD